MILRVPDYYEDFACVAGACTGSCCEGWEIDIDDATREYYCQVKDTIGERLREKLYQGEDGEYRFHLGHLGQKDRCPFLNENNLCDIYAALGEEALSEVCTDFPRFSLSYGHVMQRILSVSCEEVGRIIFEHQNPVSYVEYEMDGCVEDWEDEEADEAYIAFLEKFQFHCIDLLQNRSLSLKERVGRFLALCEKAQEVINQYALDSDAARLEQVWEEMDGLSLDTSFRTEDFDVEAKDDLLWEAFELRWSILDELEEIGQEWVDVKHGVMQTLTEDTYVSLRRNYLESEAYQPLCYEQILVYFAFRYLMQAVYSWDIQAYGKMIISFTLMVRDLDLYRFASQNGVLSMKDRIRMAYVFSREVEHSEENFEQIREELMFE